jgi:uncharacterized protein with FMN-binding domain
VTPRTSTSVGAQTYIFRPLARERSTTLTPRPDTPTKPTEWITGNLVSLGSVAVLAVYAAGYARTAEAARRFEDEDRQRRDRSRTPVVAEPVVPAVHPMEAPKPSKISAKDTAKSPKTAAKRETTTTVLAEKIDATPAAKVDTLASPAASPLAPQPSTPVPQPSTLTPQPSAVAPQPSDTTPAAETKGWKDGSYTGWGGSRHGDIQATVEIKDGKIVATWISICATNYSCSWVETLPGQVVARQSPEVDFISGATQSTNAFYYAVVQALRKAK